MTLSSLGDMTVYCPASSSQDAYPFFSHPNAKPHLKHLHHQLRNLSKGGLLDILIASPRGSKCSKLTPIFLYGMDAYQTHALATGLWLSLQALPLFVSPRLMVNMLAPDSRMPTGTSIRLSLCPFLSPPPSSQCNAPTRSASKRDGRAD